MIKENDGEHVQKGKGPLIALKFYPNCHLKWRIKLYESALVLSLVIKWSAFD